MEQRKPTSFFWPYPVLLVLALGVIAWGIYLAAQPTRQWSVLAAGCVVAFLVALMWTVAAHSQALHREAASRAEAQLAPIHERLQQVTVLLHQIAEQQLISERAKAIAFREKDREALRGAIREETARKDWDAALVLANEIETLFGYKAEADRIREEIFQQKEIETRRAVDEGLAVIDKHCRAEMWTQAMREAERLARQFPDDEQASHLPQDVENRRQQFKKQLQERFTEAVTRHDIDGGIDILKQLDLYLTPAEAQSMQDQARQLFKDRLLLLGQQFAQAVKEHAWMDAVRLGETISTEFPNSRMALEVREKMELLRTRASESSAPAKV